MSSDLHRFEADGVTYWLVEREVGDHGDRLLALTSSRGEQYFLTGWLGLLGREVARLSQYAWDSEAAERDAVGNQARRSHRLGLRDSLDVIDQVNSWALNWRGDAKGPLREARERIKAMLEVDD